MSEKHGIGIYSTEDEAISAVKRLLEIGYKKDEISVLVQNPERFERIGAVTDVPPESPKETALGAGAGIAAGGLLGGLGGLLLGMSALVIPGAGTFLAAGPIVATLSGLAAGSAVGGIVGALAGMNIDREEAQNYQNALERGEFLVLVAADSRRPARVDGAFHWPLETDGRGSGHSRRGEHQEGGAAPPDPSQDSGENPPINRQDRPPELVMNPMREPDVDPAVDFEGHPKEPGNEQHS